MCTDFYDMRVYCGDGETSDERRSDGDEVTG